jgi:hypothetical protein
MNPRYKEKVKVELDRILNVNIIEPVEESKWIIPMVVQDKKARGIRINVDLQKMNATYLHDPLPTPIIGEVLENVGGE